MQPFSARVTGHQLLQLGLDQINLIGVGVDVGDDGQMRNFRDAFIDEV